MMLTSRDFVAELHAELPRDMSSATLPMVQTLGTTTPQLDQACNKDAAQISAGRDRG